ncbi:MAG TPA: fatty acid desaturase [Pirellulaceae bacterium]|nr:fatty acid desaturase [Pirellulaceae bacterium]
MSQAAPRLNTTLNLAGPATLDRKTRPMSPPDSRHISDLPEKRRHKHETRESKKQVPHVAAEPEPSEKRSLINWPVVFWIGVLHIGALAAPFFFSWQAVVLVFALHWLTGGIGICLGFHRLITHGSFQTWRPVKWLIALIGGLAGEGSVIDWVSNHRKHHAHSDQAEDPHSPNDGGWWSHILWLLFMSSGEAHQKHVERWSPDLLKDPVLRSVGAWFLPSNIIFGVILGAIGYAVGGWYLCASFVTWGMFVRLCFVLHSTWFVNSASHMWGYRNYVTTDDSRNNWWVALLSYGEGWHNNHHAYPRMAPHGHRWWEFDLTFRTIRLMQLCGLAWDVVDYKRGGKAD